ncbi:MAG: hypothetical protein R3A11_08795 [Bdellovibrionota bacterium]
MDDVKKIFKKYCLGPYFENIENRRLLFQQLSRSLTNKPLYTSKLVVWLEETPKRHLACQLGLLNSEQTVIKKIEIGMFFKA